MLSLHLPRMREGTFQNIQHAYRIVSTSAAQNCAFALSLVIKFILLPGKVVNKRKRTIDSEFLNFEEQKYKSD